MIKSRMNNEIKKRIIYDINKFYNESLDSIYEYVSNNNVGGKIRAAMGNLGEELSKIFWMEVADLYSDISEPIEPKKGEKDKKTCVNKGGKYEAHVDKHCYIGDKFVLAIESKSYLDSCYYARASSDFRLLKKYYDKNIICIVLSIEDAAKESSKKFIEAEGWVDGAFILTNGKRSSSKPIWKNEFYKELNHEKIEKLLDFIDSLICRNISPK